MLISTKANKIGVFSLIAFIAAANFPLASAATNSPSESAIRKKIFEKVLSTPFIDTHEHLIEEKERLTGSAHPKVQCDDWAFLFYHYTRSDLLSAGMPQKDLDKFFSPKIDPLKKWPLIEPYWPLVKNTGYAQAVRLTIKGLYGIDEISKNTIPAIQKAYKETAKPGFYKKILREKANIISCQVNYISAEDRFKESDMPTLLMQDIGAARLIEVWDIHETAKRSSIKVNAVQDWYAVIDWWFDTYAQYAVAVKSQHAYARDINHRTETAKLTSTMEETFKKIINKENCGRQEILVLQDHLFWYVVKKANQYNLPVKLHTGYYAGSNSMPLSRVGNNPGSASQLCLDSRETRFVFFHICYPYYEPMIALSKQHTNAYIDMCWSWIINPIAAKDFLKKFLVTCPANKVFTFGGDYIPVELTIGHAMIARQGIASALSELVEEGLLSLEDAMELVDLIMYKNAEKFFNLEQKTKLLKNVPWKK